MNRFFISFFLLAACVFCAVQICFAQAGAVALHAKLPYTKGESFLVTTGYNSPPTHIKKDAYAIDFTQNGCGAYGKAAVAAVSGTAWVVQENGYNGGYGTQLLVTSAGAVVGRYAHLIPDSVAVASGDVVTQGMTLGEIGDTGLVAGAACTEHPGTHLHFALYDSALSTSTFTAKNPEPISGYMDIQEGKWYLSDNGSEGAVLGVAFVKEALPALPAIPIVPVGGAGITASVPLPPLPPPLILDAVLPSPSVSSSASVSQVYFSGSFNSSTLAIDFSWQPPELVALATTTYTTTTYSIFDLDGGDASSSAPVAVIASTTFSYPVPDWEFGHDATFELQAIDSSGSIFTFPESTVSIPNWFDVIQPDESASSLGSWYDDNWYNLGTGFYGTIRSLTLEGFVNTDRYSQFAAGAWIQEFLDSDYTQLNQTFSIADNMPFTDQLATVTVSGLHIPLQPNKYYRLTTYEQFQNHSILLRGTVATGTAMWDEFINGTGIVRHIYSFYPYLSVIMVPNYPPSAPPDPPAALSFSFDQFGLTLGIGWPAATDPDTTGNLLTYQFNVSTSSVLDDSQWQAAGSDLRTGINVTLGNAYTVGVRAIDDFGNVGAPIVETWQFPAGFVPYILSASVSSLSQDFLLPASTTAADGVALHSIGLFTANLSSGSRYPEYNWCTLDLYDVASDTPVYLASNDGLNQGYNGCQGSLTFVFNSTAPQLLPDHRYRWVFNINTGNPSTGAAVQFWSMGENAKFTVNASSDVLFAN